MKRIKGSDISLGDDILSSAVVDWLTAHDVYSIADEHADGEDARDLALGATSRLILQGLLVAGEVEGGRFNPWQLSVEEMVVQIFREWLIQNYRQPPPGEVAWFDTTTTGQIRGEYVLGQVCAK